MVVGAKVCDLTARGPFVVCMWFVCGNFDVFPKCHTNIEIQIHHLVNIWDIE